MKKLLFLLVVLCVLGSCDSEKKQSPEVLLSEEQMVDVMTDVQIMEGIISYKRNSNQKTAYLKTIGYDTLFSHYGITDSIFEENIKYYNDVDPQTLIRIMDSVEVRLGRMKNQ